MVVGKDFDAVMNGEFDYFFYIKISPDFLNYLIVSCIDECENKATIPPFFFFQGDFLSGSQAPECFNLLFLHPRDYDNL